MSPKIRLRQVNAFSPKDLMLLYSCLRERPKIANISHNKMPSWEEHVDFVSAKPYLNWYIVQACFKNYWYSCGNIYLTGFYEIGVFILRQFQGKGIAEMAINRLIKVNGKLNYLANIAPRNYPSKKLFNKLGFKCIQHTYRLEK